ncbi:aldehyde dehydrogenase family protein [Amycolatopsis jiangsuensis]|uniref:aldehyde dehydrogenase family protein n=1 Tax=Amycolatopsis jiangsuensis TaxID=1181879 RepID=UPI00161C5E49|nr:aldehyde dehydrogenase family protein [Amycolatopsis jiangsuensis]
MIDISEIDRIFHGLHGRRRAMRHTTAAERIERLERLRRELLARQEDIARAINADLGRPIEDRSEVAALQSNIDKARDNLAAWMQPQPVEKSPSSPEAERVFVKYEPRGVVLLFSTWNFPLSMFFSPLIQAVSAGNVVLAKPNPVTPATAVVIEEIVRAVFDEREVAVINADEIATPDGPRDANDIVLDLPVDHIFLTGSPRVGRIIVEKAAQHMASFTLELGGKNPAIVDRTADLDHVAEVFVTGKLFNHGQNCLAVDYAWVPEALRDQLVEKYVAAVRKQYYEDGVYRWRQDSRLVDKRNYERVKGYLDEAIAAGAKVAFGGGTDPENFVIEPTVLVDVPAGSRIIQEELFAPILPVLTYVDEEEIYEYVDSLGKPLGLSVHSRDEAFIQRVLDNTTSGGVTINGSNLHWSEENLPFGGVNSSGFGRYHGIWGFKELSHPRAVFHAAVR